MMSPFRMIDKNNMRALRGYRLLSLSNVIWMAYRATKAGSLKAASSVARGESFNVLMMTLKVAARVLSTFVNPNVYLEGEIFLTRTPKYPSVLEPDQMRCLWLNLS